MTYVNRSFHGGSHAFRDYINSSKVYSWALGLLLGAKLVRDHGWKCSAAIVLGITLRAAARSISLHAACCDLSKAPPRTIRSSTELS